MKLLPKTLAYNTPRVLVTKELFHSPRKSPQSVYLFMGTVQRSTHVILGPLMRLKKPRLQINLLITHQLLQRERLSYPPRMLCFL